MQEREMAEKNLILKFLAGSHAHGTNTENSDKDYIGVFIPDEEYLLGSKTCEQVQIRTNPSNSKKQNTKEDIDTVLYSLPKFVKLLAANNPTILETLYYPQKNVLFCNEYGQKLLDAAPLFPSKRVKHTFLGYAFTQKKALTHKRERYLVISEALKSLDTLEASGSPVLQEALCLTSALREDGTWGQYEKGQPVVKVRQQLEQELASYGHRIEDIKQHGFSCKFASHLVRLLDEGLEFLVEGKLTFPLSNNNLLRDIKLGKLNLEQVLALAESKEKLVEEAYVRSSLPNTPNFEAIDRLQIQLIKDFWLTHLNDFTSKHPQI